MEKNKEDNQPGAETQKSIEAGKKAIEVNRLTNDKEKPKEQQEKDEKEDAEKWRNEG